MILSVKICHQIFEWLQASHFSTVKTEFKSKTHCFDKFTKTQFLSGSLIFWLGFQISLSISLKIFFKLGGNFIQIGTEKGSQWAWFGSW